MRHRHHGPELQSLENALGRHAAQHVAARRPIRGRVVAAGAVLFVERRSILRVGRNGEKSEETDVKDQVGGPELHVVVSI